MGNAGPDRGQGGKYLFLPPDHEGEVPEGYFVFKSPTFGNWIVIRALAGLESLLTTRIYPARSDALGLQLWADGGVKVNSMQVWRLRSAYQQ